MGSLNAERAFRALTHVADALTFPVASVKGVSRESLRSSVNYEPLASHVNPLSPGATNQFIANAIERGTPCLMARFGSTEMRVVLRHHGRHSRTPIEKFYAMVSRLEAPVWAPWEHRNIRTKSGFYPASRRHTDQFVDVMIDSMRELDLLASWVPGENKLAHHFSSAAVTHLTSFNALDHNDLWTKKLRGKKVLVVHPFKETIEAQYEKRRLLFTDPEVLPGFDLKTLKAVQSLGTPPRELPTWFDALDHMHSKSQEVDYDIALIGAGGYGLPLGARLKNDGKPVIVLGGIVQLLFGIMGKRWDSSGLYNEHWVRPSDSERPDGFRGADGGAYW